MSNNLITESVLIDVGLSSSQWYDQQQKSKSVLPIFDINKSKTNNDENDEILLDTPVELTQTQRRNIYDTAFYKLDNKLSREVNIFDANRCPPPAVYSPTNYEFGDGKLDDTVLQAEPEELGIPSFDLPSHQIDGSNALSTLMFTDSEIVDYRETLEDIRGEDLAYELCCRSWDFLEGINLEWAIRNNSWFSPYFKQRRVMFCDAFKNIYGELANLGQSSKGTCMAIRMAFGTKISIKYQGSIPTNKMDEGNKSVLYMMRDMIFKAFRDGGTVSDEWTKDAAFKVSQALITFSDWSLLCCEGDENDVNGTSWETMKEQLERRGGLMLWRMFAVINSGWNTLEYHIDSEGEQLQLLEASSRTMELSHGRSTDDILSNKLIQIFPLCHANAQELYMSNRQVFSYERLLKLNENLARYLRPLVGRTIPDGNDTLVLHEDDFNYFIKLAQLHDLFPDQIEEVYELDKVLRAERKNIRMALEAELQLAAQAIANGEGTLRDLAFTGMLANDSAKKKLIEICMYTEQIGNKVQKLAATKAAAEEKKLTAKDQEIKLLKEELNKFKMNQVESDTQAMLLSNEANRWKKQATKNERKLKELDTKLQTIENGRKYKELDEKLQPKMYMSQASIKMKNDQNLLRQLKAQEQARAVASTISSELPHPADAWGKTITVSNSSRPVAWKEEKREALEEDKIKAKCKATIEERKRLAEEIGGWYEQSVSLSTTQFSKRGRKKSTSKKSSTSKKKAPAKKAKKEAKHTKTKK